MALQLIARPLARKVYRDAKGRFISKAKYELNQRRDPATGRFITKAAAARRPDPKIVEGKLRKELGAPPAGRTWTEIAARYTERFEDYLRDI